MADRAISQGQPPQRSLLLYGPRCLTLCLSFVVRNTSPRIASRTKFGQEPSEIVLHRAELDLAVGRVEDGVVSVIYAVAVLSDASGIDNSEPRMIHTELVVRMTNHVVAIDLD